MIRGLESITSFLSISSVYVTWLGSKMTGTRNEPLFVFRKLSEFGYQRSARKCKEKFENIYKYNKRTKDCRPGQQNGKNYRYHEQLQLLDSHSSLPSPSQCQTYAKERAMTTTKTTINPLSFSQGVNASCSIPTSSGKFMAPTSSVSSLGKESETKGKKRKRDHYFERLMKEVLERQENLQNKFIEALEKCEKDRMAREEAWRSQESAMLKREKEMLAEERAISAARDAAVIAFLQKFSEKGVELKFLDIPVCVPSQDPSEISREKHENGFTESSIPMTCLRWPKEEVLALINVKTDIDLHYQDTGSKGPLWEEISMSMKKLGYNRSAKRCKEKWENINKYFKRVKEGNKERSHDSKTCPYFKKLESLYGSKAKKPDAAASDTSVCNVKPADILEQLTTPSPPPPQQQHHHHQEQGLESMRRYDEDDDDDSGQKYQIVATDASPVTTWDGETICRNFSIKS